MAIPGLDFNIGDTVTYLGEDAEVIAVKDGGSMVSISPKGARVRWVKRGKLSVDGEAMDAKAEKRGDFRHMDPDQNLKALDAERASMSDEKMNTTEPTPQLPPEARALYEVTDNQVRVVHPMIYQLLADVMAQVGSVGKTSKAPHAIGGFKFRGIDAIMEALQPALIRCNVIVLPEVLECIHSEYSVKEGKMQHFLVKVRYTFYAPDGSSVACVAMGEGADKGDKGVNKAMAGAMKYAITQSLAIPTSEKKDAEHDETDLSGGREGEVGSFGEPAHPAARMPERMSPDEYRPLGEPNNPPPPPDRTARVDGYLAQGSACATQSELVALAAEVAQAGLSPAEKAQIQGPWRDIKNQLAVGGP